jgi:hypothetical protein
MTPDAVRVQMISELCDASNPVGCSPWRHRPCEHPTGLSAICASAYRMKDYYYYYSSLLHIQLSWLSRGFFGIRRLDAVISRCDPNTAAATSMMRICDILSSRCRALIIPRRWRHWGPSTCRHVHAHSLVSVYSRYLKYSGPATWIDISAVHGRLCKCISVMTDCVGVVLFQSCYIKNGQ